MDDFNYLAVLISIILGLGITQLLSGFGRWMENRASIAIYPPTIVWVITLLVMHIQIWWSMYGLRQHLDWTFLQFVVVLLQPTTLFLLTTAVLPSSASTVLDLKSNYFAQRRWFFGLLVVLLAVSVSRDIVLTGSLPAATNLGFHALFLLIAVSGLAIAKESYHRALAYSMAVIVTGYIALLYPELR